MQVELDNFEDGRPMVFKTNQETAQKIKVYKGKKQYKELLQLANSMPNTRQKYFIQSNAFLYLKKWKQLCESCDRGLDLSEQKDSSDFYNLKGKALGKLGNFQQKVKYTSKAIQIDPNVAAYHRNLGAAYYKLKQYERALACHSKAMQLQPEHSVNYHNKGAAFFRLQRFEDAVGCFQKATDLDKKLVISYAWLADSHKQLGNYAKAKHYYQRAYELSDQQDYKKLAKQMDSKLNPNKKKGFFSKLFG